MQNIIFHNQTTQLSRALTKNTIRVSTFWNKSLPDQIMKKSVWNLNTDAIKL